MVGSATAPRERAPSAFRAKKDSHLEGSTPPQQHFTEQFGSLIVVRDSPPPSVPLDAWTAGPDAFHGRVRVVALVNMHMFIEQC